MINGYELLNAKNPFQDIIGYTIPWNIISIIHFDAYKNYENHIHPSRSYIQ